VASHATCRLVPFDSIFPCGPAQREVLSVVICHKQSAFPKEGKGGGSEAELPSFGFDPWGFPSRIFFSHGEVGFTFVLAKLIVTNLPRGKVRPLGTWRRPYAQEDQPNPLPRQTSPPTPRTLAACPTARRSRQCGITGRVCWPAGSPPPTRSPAPRCTSVCTVADWNQRLVGSPSRKTEM